MARVLDRLHGRDRPAAVASSSTTGRSLPGRTLDAWAYARGVTLRFIRPGKPIENAYVESFNGKFRDECLNEHWFLSLADAKAAIEAWRVDYNTVRPHSSLDGATPDQFARITEGARRLTPARPDKTKTENPRTSHYPCSGFWGQVRVTPGVFTANLACTSLSNLVGDFPAVATIETAGLTALFVPNY